MKQNKKIGYMCRTDFENELEHASDGNKIFPSVEALKHHLHCVDMCGIVEVEVTLKRVVEVGKDNE